MIITREMIEILAESHDRTSCNDDNCANNYPNSSGFIRCNRCFLLAHIGSDTRDLLVKINVTVSIQNN